MDTQVIDDCFDLRGVDELEAPVAADVNLVPLIRQRLASSSPHRWRRAALILLPASALVCALASGTVVALSSRTMPVSLHRQVVPASGSGRAISVTGGGSVETTLAKAAQLGGFDALGLHVPGATLDKVTYHAPITSVDGKPIPHNSGAVALDYTLAAGQKVQLVEQRDSNGPGPMSVTVKQPDAPVPNLAQNQTEIIDGNEYFVTATADGSKVLGIQWKTSDGLIFRLNCPGLDRQTVAKLVSSIS